MTDLAIWDNSHRDFFVNIDLLWIDSAKSYQDFNDFDKVKRIFIRAELNWPDVEPATAFYGFELVLDLRKRKIKCPIFICSFLPRSYFLTLSLEMFGLLRLVHAHPFVLLPAIIQDNIEKQQTSPLTDLQLQDAITHFGNPHGVLEEQLHYLKNWLPIKGEEVIETVFGYIEGIVLHNKIDLLRKYKHDFAHTLNQQEKSENIFQQINELKIRIKPLLPSVVSEHTYVPPQMPWRVLYIDDQKGAGKKLKEMLAPEGIHCVLAHTGQEALDILKQEYVPKYQNGELVDFNTWGYNSITVVVCDLRFETSTRDWQIMQGYDIIKKIHEELPNFVSFIILSAKRNALTNLRHSFQHIRWRGFQKESVFSSGPGQSGFDIFTDHIRQEGNEVYEILYSQPKAKAWYEPWIGKINAPLQRYYRIFRMSREYLPKEHWIGECAKDFIYEAELVKDSFFPKKNKIGTLGFSSQFKAGIPDPHPTSNSKSMDQFHVKLIGRRIAIGLHLKGWDVDDISNILKKGELTNDMVDRQLFNSYLALSTNLKNEVPVNLLVEERIWVENTLGYSLNTEERYFFSALKEILAEWQDKLRKSGSIADFVEEEIHIGNERDAHRHITETVACCRAFPNLESEFSHHLNEFYQHKRYHDIAAKYKFI